MLAWYSWSLRPLHTRKVPGSNPGASTLLFFVRSFVLRSWFVRSRSRSLVRSPPKPDMLSERLRSWTRNPLGPARVGSNPAHVDSEEPLVSHLSLQSIIFVQRADRALSTGFDPRVAAAFCCLCSQSQSPSLCPSISSVPRPHLRL